MKAHFVCVPFILILLVLAPGSACAEEPSPELPPGKGRDLVLNNCTVCHSAAIILQNHMTREKWDETITWMQKTQGLWELEPEVRNGILDYLATVRGVNPDKESAAGSTTPPHPMYDYDYPPNPL